MNAPGPPEDDGKRKPFNWRQVSSRLSRQLIDRQSLITHFAYARLGGRDPAMAFLNVYHAGLGAKPLDLAGGSAAGYSTVLGEINRLASLLEGGQQ